MRLAIMQPYIFPYIGYFQLIQSVDRFVFYDDVNYIKQGWINRNRILVGGKEHLFSIPIKKISSFTLINKTEVDEKPYAVWRKKFLRTIDLSYKKAPFFSDTFKLINRVFVENPTIISEFAVKSVMSVAKHLDLPTHFIRSSGIYENLALSGQERVLDICKTESASVYINPVAGRELYSKDQFVANGIRLNFLDPMMIKYKQFNQDYVPWLSIIDVMMFNPVEQIRDFLTKYELI
jgi:hypothetical protein